MSFPYRFETYSDTTIYTLETFIEAVKADVGEAPAFIVKICMGHFIKKQPNEKRNYKITFVINTYSQVVFTVKGGWGKAYKTRYKFEEGRFYIWRNNYYFYEETIEKPEFVKYVKALEFCNRYTNFLPMGNDMRQLDYKPWQLIQTLDLNQR